jgi:glycosyltransferase involved in cell wall biosynthesis
MQHWGSENAPPHLINPVMIPWFGQTARVFNRISLGRTYRNVAERNGVRSPVFVAVYPCGVDLIESVEPAVSIYYCVDEYSELQGGSRPHWERMEAELIEKVDALVVTSHELGRKRRQGKPLLYLPHGVDFAHFHGSAGSAETASPVPRMDSIPRPIVGFFGVIGPWVDLPIVARLATEFPQVSFVLIGKSEVSLAPVDALRNVHCLGQVPYASLPCYARYFDVGLIPFLVNPLTLAVNPVKLLEYYALGLPVLATRLPELESVKGPIWLASSRGEFSSALRQILSLDVGLCASEALDIARKNTWDRRVGEFSDFVSQLEKGVSARRTASAAGTR